MYEVIVGNIGTVHRGPNRFVAVELYEAYRRMSADGYGRAAGESVTLTDDNEPVMEHIGKQALAESEPEELWDADPNCQHEMDPECRSGIRCKKCAGGHCL